MIPETIRNFNLVADGYPFLGVAEEVTLPKIKVKTDSFRAAGMLGEVDVDMGVEKLVMDFTLAKFSREILGKLGVFNDSGRIIRFLGAAQENGAAGISAIEVATRGQWTEVDMGTIKGGDRSKMKVTAGLTYYRYSVNNQPIITIDMIAGVYVTGGEDRYAAILQAIGAKE
jgi:P2 family phage contractile tail tube protein